MWLVALPALRVSCSALLVAPSEDFLPTSVFCVYNLTEETGRAVAVVEGGKRAEVERSARLVQDSWLVQYAVTGEAERLAPRPPGTEGGAVVQYGDSLCLVGGAGGEGASARVHCWNPLGGGQTWVELAPMLRARFRPGAVVMDGKLYVVGGYDPSSHTFLTEAEVFDDVQQAWFPLPSLSAGRAGLGLAPLDGRLYAVGGWRGHSYLRYKRCLNNSLQPRTLLFFRDVEVYDSLVGRWSPGPSLQERRGKLGLVTAGTDPPRLYALAGVSGFRRTDQLDSVERWVKT